MPIPIEERKEIAKRYAKLVAKAWADEAFRQHLISNPATVLRESGFDVPEGKDVRIIEADMEKTIYFVLPPKPAEAFSESDVDPALTFPCTVCCSWCGPRIHLCG
jgi:hypothetical protein